jgi:hypothetical protein
MNLFKTLIIALVVSAAGSLTACNTIHGARQGRRAYRRSLGEGRRLGAPGLWTARRAPEPSNALNPRHGERMRLRPCPRP